MCMACGSKVNDWREHCETKRHLKEYKLYCERTMNIDKALFDCKWVTKYVFLFPLMPKVPWKPQQRNLLQKKTTK